MTGAEPQPFRIDIDQRELDALRQRLHAMRWPDAETVDDWSQGVPLAYCRELAAHWADAYDWRRCEQRLNGWPNFLAALPLGGQSHDIHFIHRRSSNPDARPLLITHGWPGAVLEFCAVIDALAEPQDHGGRAEDAFHVVLPSLPGYGFSSKPSGTGTGVETIADLWAALMALLGYQRFYAQGGDWGSLVATSIAQRHPQQCAGIHLNMIVAPPDPATFDDLSADEQAALAQQKHHAAWDSAYARQQSTRPQTLTYALADSPAGQLAWIAEKFWAWTDCERDGVRHPENAVARDDLLDIVTLYWLTNTAGSSARLYWESYRQPNLEPVSVPMGGSCFPKDIFLTSERWARRRFPGLVYWNAPHRGGHFAALEQPRLFVEELRRCFAAIEGRAA